MARECETQPDSRQRTRLEHFGRPAGSAGLESGSAAPNQVRMSSGRPRPPRNSGTWLDVEPDVQDVAVADDIGLPLQPLLPVLRPLRVRAELDEVAPVDDL